MTYRAAFHCSSCPYVHSKAALMLSGVIGDEVHRKIFWPQIPYVTNENGDIYIEVRNEEDILQNLTAENNFVKVIIGLDNLEMLPQTELANQHDIDFGIEEVMRLNHLILLMSPF